MFHILDLSDWLLLIWAGETPLGDCPTGDWNFCFPGEGLMSACPSTVGTESDSWVVMAHGGKHSPRWGEKATLSAARGRLRTWGEETGPRITVVMDGTGGRCWVPALKSYSVPKGRGSAFVVVMFASQDHEKKHSVSVWRLSFNFQWNWVRKVPLGQI